MRIIIVAFLLLIGSTASSQTYKFKAFQVKYIDKEDKRNSTDWEDRDILIVINTDRKKLYTYGEKEGEYDLIFRSEYKDDSGNTILKYTGIDEDGLRMSISVILYRDQTGRHGATLILDYSNIALYFRLKWNSLNSS